MADYRFIGKFARLPENQFPYFKADKRPIRQPP